MAAAEYMELKTHADWKRYLKRLLYTNDKALLKSVLVIYGRQTEGEQASSQSTEDNGIGFTKYDAGEMSRIAKKIQCGMRLEHKEMVRARTVMPKYWRQLMDVSKFNIAKKRQEELDKAATAEREHFRQINNAMVECLERGVSCDYGICDECVVGRGIQMTCM